MILPRASTYRVLESGTVHPRSHFKLPTVFGEKKWEPVQKLEGTKYTRSPWFLLGTRPKDPSGTDIPEDISPPWRTASALHTINCCQNIVNNSLTYSFHFWPCHSNQMPLFAFSRSKVHRVVAPILTTLSLHCANPPPDTLYIFFFQQVSQCVSGVTDFERLLADCSTSRNEVDRLADKLPIYY